MSRSQISPLLRRAPLLRAAALSAVAACSAPFEEGPKEVAGDAEDTGSEALDSGGSGSGSSGSGSSGSGSSGSGSGSGGGSTSDIPPVVTFGDAWCYHHTTGEERDLWKVVATVTEPQGLDTLIQNAPGAVTVSSGTTVLAAFDLACDLTTGECSSSFSQEEAGALCDNAAAHTIAITALDEDDNWAEPYVVTGRQSATPEG
jgi:hypothetical protein